MGVCGSTVVELSEDDLETIRVEKQLLDSALNELFIFKVLLLGAGESGKSTVLKQMQLSHNHRPSSTQLKAIADALHQNVIDCMQALLYACVKFKYPLECKAHEDTMQKILAYEGEERLDEEFGDEILDLWGSDPIKKAYKRRNEFWLLDSCKYYMTHLERFCEDDFVPGEEDQVMARIRTTGIQTTNLVEKNKTTGPGVPSQITWKVVDVGGQRNERKKWIHCFDDVHCILFLVNLAGYNQVLFEDNRKNRMHESLELFEEIVKKKIFQDTPVVLMLNKKDLFESMILETDLSVAFPEYTGGKNLKNALIFIQEQFLKRLPDNKRVMIHVVTGILKADIKNSFKSVKQSLLQINAKKQAKAMADIQKQKEQLAKREGR